MAASAWLLETECSGFGYSVGGAQSFFVSQAVLPHSTAWRAILMFLTQRGTVRAAVLFGLWTIRVSIPRTVDWLAAFYR